MFTGIIQQLGTVKQVIINGSNRSFWIDCPRSSSFRVDQSVSHDGVCLTVEALNENCHKVTAIEETLKKTSLGLWETGTVINLEESLALNDRLDGHLVQGHVDCTALCGQVSKKDGSIEFRFRFPKKFAPLIIEKGSIAVNGISLTAIDVKKKSFRVAIIPYTLEHTNLKYLQKGDTVNLEFDILGKYVKRWAKR